MDGEKSVNQQEPLPTMAELNRELQPYQRANTRHSLLQLANTLIPYALLWVLMYRSLSISYALTLLLSVIAAGFLVRVFIFFHDCGHNSFFPSTRWNKRVGFWLGVLVFTPGEHWWHSHAIHHATSGNLDKRGIGDVETLTVAEYQALPWLRKLGYRLFRNPIIMLGLGPLYMFVIMHRFNTPKFGRKETNSVILTNLAMLAILIIMSMTIGIKEYLIIQLPVMLLAGMMGIYLFYVQHQFEDAYWARDDEWSYIASALKGASYYKLPAVLQWFSGNIGFHNLHHLSPRIPNYALPQCFKSIPALYTNSRTIKFWESFKTLGLSLWDEQQKRMIGFKQLKKQTNRS